VRVLLWSGTFRPALAGVKVFVAQLLLALRTHGRKCLEYPEGTTQLGQAAPRGGYELFRWQRCVDAYDALYQQLLSQGRRSKAVAQS